MVWSMIFCSVTSWGSAVLMLFCAENYEEYMLASQPYMNWFMDIYHSTYGGGVFCALVMIGLNYFIVVGTNTAGSRLAWSMARDRAFPYSSYFASVNKRFGIPLRAMIAILFIDLIIGLIVLGGHTEDGKELGQPRKSETRVLDAHRPLTRRRIRGMPLSG